MKNWNVEREGKVKRLVRLVRKRIAVLSS